MTQTQQRILAAVEAGHTSLRSIAKASGLASTSNVRYHLKTLAAEGHLVLRQRGKLTEIDNGQDFCAGWDAAARLAGNPEA